MQAMMPIGFRLQVLSPLRVVPSVPMQFLKPLLCFWGLPLAYATQWVAWDLSSDLYGLVLKVFASWGVRHTCTLGHDLRVCISSQIEMYTLT